MAGRKIFRFPSTNKSNLQGNQMETFTRMKGGLNGEQKQAQEREKEIEKARLLNPKREEVL